MNKILEVENLSIAFQQYYQNTKQRYIKPVKDLSIEIKEAEIMAIVGASGSGKSLLAHAILGVLPSNSEIKGVMKYRGNAITKADIEKMRGNKIRYIPQSVKYLDPTMKVGKQLKINLKNKTKEEILKKLKQFSLDKEVYDYYPHQLSGGMLRRILFLSCLTEHTELIIADEPTPGVHPEILEELLQSFLSFKEKGISVIFITHDMKAALKIADRVATFKEGKVIDISYPSDILNGNPNLNDYVKKLWNSQPSNRFLEEVK